MKLGILHSKHARRFWTFLSNKKRLNLLKNQANFPVSSTQLPHSWFVSYKSLFCMRKIFLKRILCLFKKVTQDDQCVEKNCTRKSWALGAGLELVLEKFIFQFWSLKQNLQKTRLQSSSKLKVWTKPYLMLEINQPWCRRCVQCQHTIEPYPL